MQPAGQVQRREPGSSSSVWELGALPAPAQLWGGRSCARDVLQPRSREIHQWPGGNTGLPGPAAGLFQPVALTRSSHQTKLE